MLFDNRYYHLANLITSIMTFQTKVKRVSQHSFNRI
uniref:Uncharacterized protein n=1 Tax=Podoviridae sp. ctZkC8 TaxID=2825259 RepID=A0A8S5UBL8_9CAUD|nr:MAG TPA: hypothetical protein [Podoviridae sp. ctZkC8]